MDEKDIESMTEREKMLAGLPYRASDPELLNRRLHARRLIRLYNATEETETIRRHELLKQLFGATGTNLVIEPPFHCDYGSNIYVGEDFYANFNCVILDVNEVRIGDFVLLAPGVHIYTAYHPLNISERISGVEMGAPVTIGNGVWIGGGAIINPGVTIGEHSVIGAGSVVTKDIPPNVVAAGNPCRVLRPL